MSNYGINYQLHKKKQEFNVIINITNVNTLTDLTLSVLHGN